MANILNASGLTLTQVNGLPAGSTITINGVQYTKAQVTAIFTYENAVANPIYPTAAQLTATPTVAAVIMSPPAQTPTPTPTPAPPPAPAPASATGVVRIFSFRANQYVFVPGVVLNNNDGSVVGNYAGVPIYSQGLNTSTVNMPYLVLSGNTFACPPGSQASIGGGSYSGQQMEDANLAYSGTVAPF